MCAQPRSRLWLLGTVAGLLREVVGRRVSLKKQMSIICWKPIRVALTSRVRGMSGSSDGVDYIFSIVFEDEGIDPVAKLRRQVGESEC